jgi:hypothetical protein
MKMLRAAIVWMGRITPELCLAGNNDACVTGPEISTVPKTAAAFWLSAAVSAASVAKTLHAVAQFLDHGRLFRIVELAVPIGIDIVETTREGTGNFLLGEEAVTIRIPLLQTCADLFSDASESFGLILRLSCFPPLRSFLCAPRQGNGRVQFDAGLAGSRRVLSLGNVRTWRRDGSI